MTSATAADVTNHHVDRTVTSNEVDYCAVLHVSDAVEGCSNDRPTSTFSTSLVHARTVTDTRDAGPRLLGSARVLRALAR
jgi:hypothetical protein